MPHPQAPLLAATAANRTVLCMRLLLRDPTMWAGYSLLPPLPVLPLWGALLNRPPMAEFMADNQAVVKVCKAGGRRISCTFPELTALWLLP